MAKSEIATPVGRLVQGSLSKPQTTDMDGKPLVFKSGEPGRVKYFFALAIPKGTEKHWSETAWGQAVRGAATEASPQASMSPGFVWKIGDGDSTVPNKTGKAPCQTEGFPGHWVLRFENGYAPKIYRKDGSGYVQVLEEEFLKLGYYCQVAFSVVDNKSKANPGVIFNPNAVAFSAYGVEIAHERDVNDLGFGEAPLPSGASMTPLPSGAGFPGSGEAPPPPLMPNPGVVPNLNFAKLPPVPIPPVPPSPPAKRMTAAANGMPYESFIAAGWTDDQLIVNGFLLV